MYIGINSIKNSATHFFRNIYIVRIRMAPMIKTLDALAIDKLKLQSGHWQKLKFLLAKRAWKAVIFSMSQILYGLTTNFLTSRNVAKIYILNLRKIHTTCGSFSNNIGNIGKLLTQTRIAFSNMFRESCQHLRNLLGKVDCNWNM